MLDNARLPSFHIKRLIDKSNKKRREDRSREVSEAASCSPKMPLITQNELRRYWQSYLQDEKICLQRSPHSGSPERLSPTVNRTKRGGLGLCGEGPEDRSLKKGTFFVNNFVRTSCRFKEGAFRAGPQLSLNERRAALKSRESNQMAPWERELDNAEDEAFSFCEPIK